MFTKRSCIFYSVLLSASFISCSLLYGSNETGALQHIFTTDPLLQDIRAQSALRKRLSKTGEWLDFISVMDSYFVPHTTDDLENFYIADTLWTSCTNHAEGSLSILCNREIVAQRYHAKNYLAQVISNTVGCITNYFNPRAQQKLILDFATIKALNTKLSTTLKQMKQNGATSYDAYLNEVKNFVMRECAALERENNKQ